MYAFVHCVPLLISRKFWKLVYGATRSMLGHKDRENNLEDGDDDRIKLMKLFLKKIEEIIRSSLFFVCFQHFSKLLICYWRYYVMRSDPIWSTVGCVYIATLLAQVFETPKRRIQYTLYTSTHVLKMIGNAIQLKYGKRIEKNNKLNWIYEYWSIIMLQITFAIWSFMKGIGRNKKFCSYWSQFAMDTVI